MRRAGARAAGGPSPSVGKREFDAVRAALAQQAAELGRVRTAGRAKLNSSARFLTATFIAVVALIAIGIVGALLILRLTTTRPLRLLGRSVRRIARGEFDHEIARAGARDVVDLGDDVDSMRQRIVAELSSLREAHDQLDAQARELARSNAELEQFAYVASHDLQEPLRKVASFCQLLEQRYEGQLDERGRPVHRVRGRRRQAHAAAHQRPARVLARRARRGRAAGRSPATTCCARRSRTSARRSRRAAREVDGRAAAAGARRAGAAGRRLPEPDRQRAQVPPRRRRRRACGSSRRAQTATSWVFTCADNGIGIEPEYAERIFVIFQRLHPKDAYPGTGIGLAMCRKIVEHHGGRIWVDTAAPGGQHDLPLHPARNR